MKNAINYYYNLFPQNIYQSNNKYRFSYNDLFYYFIEYSYSLEKLDEIYRISNTLLNYNVYCHKIILNNMGYYSTNINGKYYVMLLVNNFYDESICFDDLLYYFSITGNFHLEKIFLLNDCRKNWINKVDYFEYEIENFKTKFLFVYKISSYYIGMAENAIQLLLNLKKTNFYCISHFRINYNSTLFDLYNPLEFTVDNGVRDFSEYIKSMFFYKQLSFNDIEKYLKKFIFSYDDALLFMARLFFPTYFFDMCDEIFYSNFKENELNVFVVKNLEYEKFLSKIMNYLAINYNIPRIEWLDRY